MNPFKEFWVEVENKVLESQSDVISLIKADHRKVDLLFQQYMNSSDSAEKQSIMKSIIDDLRVHADAEEGKVYPILDGEDHAGANEALEEHHLIKILIEELSGMTKITDKTDAKVKVLSEVVKHHVNEEESKYLLELKNSDADLEAMGESFTAEKERLSHQSVDPADKKPMRKLAAVKDLPQAEKAVPAKKAASARKAAPAKKPVPAKKAAPAKKIAPAKKTPAKKPAPVKLRTSKSAAKSKAS